ncbi:MAG TPA: response regulator [Planctomycetaceae bacterium]|nr:response regulator [Planctomycetaceae bacterium]
MAADSFLCPGILRSMKTLLLVDDSPTVRHVERNILGPLGFQIIEATNGDEALCALREHPEIEIMLLDWNMPVMNGIECLRRLREEFAGRPLKVLMCTTEGEMGRILEAMQAGADEYIMKPFTAEIVQGKLAGAGAL